jgi:hypothetical protein
MKERDSLIDLLEDEVDKFGLCEVVSALESICYLKAEHLRSNWQDELTAKLWEKRAAKIERSLNTL